MCKDWEVAVVRELIGHIESGTTASAASMQCNDASMYFSREVLEREKTCLFHALPLVAALSADIPEVGCYLAHEVAGVPYVLVRSRDGRPRAFLNACRHRGSRLVTEPRGRRAGLSCPFHAWSYDLEGRLVSVPRASTVGEFDREAQGLIALPVAEKYGLIWITLRPGKDFDIDPCLSGLGPELAHWNLQSLYARGPRELRLPLNWKLANDTFGETYHFEVLHRNTLSATYHSNVTAYETFGCNHRMVFASRTIESLRGLPESEWELRPHATIVYFLFPNTQLLIAPNYVATYRMFPDGEQPDRSRIYQSIYLSHEPHSEADKDDEQRILKVHQSVILDEDFAIAESAQVALSSGLMKHVVYARNEPALHHYHASFRRALGLGALSGIANGFAGGSAPTVSGKCWAVA